MLSKEQIDKLKELVAKATHGDLQIDDDHWVNCVSEEANDGYTYAQTHGPDACANAEFIAAASPAVVSELIAMLEESQKDAARYRWLRSENTGPSMIEVVSDDCNPPSITLKCEEELDLAIDAAMQRDCDGAQHSVQP